MCDPAHRVGLRNRPLGAAGGRVDGDVLHAAPEVLRRVPAVPGGVGVDPAAGDHRLRRALPEADDLGIEADRHGDVVGAGLEHQLIALRAELVRLLRGVDLVDVVLDRGGRHRGAEHVDIRAEVRRVAGRRRPAGQGPLLVGGVGAGPDLDLGAGAAVSGVVEALAGVGVDQFAVGLRFPDLGAGAVAVIQVDGGAVGGACAVDVQALAQHFEGVVGLHRPLLGVAAVAGVDLDRVGVRGAGRAVVQAQALVPDDRAGGGGGRGIRGIRAARLVSSGRAEAENEGYHREGGEELPLHGRFHCWLEVSAQAQIWTWVPEPP